MCLEPTSPFFLGHPVYVYLHWLALFFLIWTPKLPRWDYLLTEWKCCIIIITDVKLRRLGLARNFHFIISLQMRLATLQSTRGSSYWPVPGIYDIFSTTHLSLVFQSIAPQTSNSKGNANIYFLLWIFFLKFWQIEIYLLFDKVSTYTILRALLFHFPPFVYHPPWT